MSSVFKTGYEEIVNQLQQVDPVAYGKSRNFIDGSVTRLSPYISRGVISTSDVLKCLQKKNFKPYEMEKFVQELAWRDYWQQIWIAKGMDINKDLRQPQADVFHHKMPLNIIKGYTGISAIDDAISSFYETGYLHNHVRMYIASLACNTAKSHWNAPARWMYYHLLDADWASNALSWQWVAGCNSSKKYYANQENINKYCNSRQAGTYLDRGYEELVSLPVPDRLKELADAAFETPLPENEPLVIDQTLPVCIYNFYNLDPLWKKEVRANRILLLEPSHFTDYPVSENTIGFILDLSKNIEGIQVYTGEFGDMVKAYSLSNIFYKEHPLNNHYSGTEESRDWMFSVHGYYPSFFAFWKRCSKEWKS